MRRLLWCGRGLMVDSCRRGRCCSFRWMERWPSWLGRVLSVVASTVHVIAFLNGTQYPALKAGLQRTSAVPALQASLAAFDETNLILCAFGEDKFRTSETHCAVAALGEA